MRVCCSKCKKILSKDLYYVKLKYKKGTKESIPYSPKVFDMWFDEYGYLDDLKFKNGIFTITKEIPSYNWKATDRYASKYEWDEVKETEKSFFSVIKKEKSQLLMSEDSLLDNIVPKNPTSCCCNWSAEPLICECGNELGIMNFDCCDLGFIGFDLSKIDRFYK